MAPPTFKKCIVNIINLRIGNILDKILRKEENDSDVLTNVTIITDPLVTVQWRSQGNWRPGANLNFAPPPQKKNPKK